MARSAHLITFLAALLLLTSCATKRITTTTDTASIAIRVDTLRDSIFHTDSIYILDSVFVMAKNDTITKVVTEQKVTEKKLSKWQQLQMWCGRILLLIAAGIAAIIAVKLIKHKL